jgi:hypothetical protein
MDLYLWLAKKRMSKTDFAKRVKTSRIHIHRIIDGYSVSSDLLQRIVEETNGEVRPQDIKPKPRKSKKKPKGPKMTQLDAFECQK